MWKYLYLRQMLAFAWKKGKKSGEGRLGCGIALGLVEIRKVIRTHL